MAFWRGFTAKKWSMTRCCWFYPYVTFVTLEIVYVIRLKGFSSLFLHRKHPKVQNQPTVNVDVCEIISFLLVQSYIFTIKHQWIMITFGSQISSYLWCIMGWWYRTKAFTYTYKNNIKPFVFFWFGRLFFCIYSATSNKYYSSFATRNIKKNYLCNIWKNLSYKYTMNINI